MENNIYKTGLYKAEQELWKSFIIFKDAYGADDKITLKTRHSWATIVSIITAIEGGEQA